MRKLLFSVAALACTLGCTCSGTPSGPRERGNAPSSPDPGFGSLPDGGLPERGAVRESAQSSSAAVKKTKPAQKRCRVAAAQQSIRALGTAVSDEEFAPFGVEVGVPLVGAQSFWVPWLSSDGKTSTAGVTEVSSDLLTARPVQMGQVFWDGGPPRVARVNDKTLLAVVPDGDAHGGSYRVAIVGPNGVSWGANIDGSSDDSPAFDLSASGGKALLVWDDYVREEARGTVAGVTLGPDGQVVRSLGRLSPPSSDVEGPRLARHRNGYWLAWLRVEWAPKAKGSGVPGPATAVPVADEQAALQVSERWIEVVPLDLEGTVSGEPIRVSGADAMVQGFDLEAGHEGGLVLSWRQDFSNSGTNGGAIWTARLSADGALEAHPVDAPAVGGTLPVLLFDPKPPSGVPHGWLSVETNVGESALCALSPFGRPLEVLTGNVGLGVASVLAALEGHLLLAKPKGRDIVLELAQCDYSPASPGLGDAGVAEQTSGSP